MIRIGGSLTSRSVRIAEGLAMMIVIGLKDVRDVEGMFASLFKMGLNPSEKTQKRSMRNMIVISVSCFGRRGT